MAGKTRDCLGLYEGTPAAPAMSFIKPSWF
jgi:hypothetical protein